MRSAGVAAGSSFRRVAMAHSGTPCSRAASATVYEPILLSTPTSVTASAPIQTALACETSSGSAASATSQLSMPASASARAVSRPSSRGRLSATSTRTVRPEAASSRIAARTPPPGESVAIQGSRAVTSWAASFAAPVPARARSSRSASQLAARWRRRSATASPRATPASATASARAANWWTSARLDCAACAARSHASRPARSAAASALRSVITQRSRSSRNPRPTTLEPLVRSCANAGAITGARRSGCGRCTRARSPAEQPLEPQQRGLPAQLAERLGERDVLGAHLHAQLRVPAVHEPAPAHDRVQPLVRVHAPGRVAVEEPHLRERRGPDELGLLVVLRAHLHAAAAGHAARERVAHLLLGGREARPGAEVVRAVDGDPRLDALESVEHRRAVHLEVPDDGELGERLERDRSLAERVHEHGARLARLTVHEHGARSAHLLEARRLPVDRRRGLALPGDRVLADLHQARDHVHVDVPGERDLLPARAAGGRVLALDAQLHGPGHQRILAARDISRTSARRAC